MAEGNPNTPGQQQSNVVPFTSSGDFDEGPPQGAEYELDPDIFVAPSGVSPDASIEDQLAYDPVADSEQRWEEQQRAAEQQRTEQQQQQELSPQQVQEPTPAFLDPALNPPDPSAQPQPPQPLPQPDPVPMQQAQMPGAVPPVVPQQAAPAVPPQVDPQVLMLAQNEALRSQIATMQTQLQQLQSGPPATSAQAQYAQRQMPGGAQPQQGQPAQEQPEPIPAYQYNIDPNIVNAIRSDDANQASMGLSALVSQVAQAVHSQVRQEYRSYVPQQVTTVAQDVVQRQLEADKAARQVREDFFGSFPQFGDAAKENPLEPLIGQKVREVMGRTGLPWGQVVKNMVATELYTMLGGQYGTAPAQGIQSQPQPLPQQQAGVVPRQSAQASLTPPGTRPDVQSMNPEMREHMQVADLFMGSGTDHPSGAFG